MKYLKLIGFVTCLLIMGLVVAANTITEDGYKYSGYETSDTNYHNGQILYPDYVHNDTLVVVNADSLNWCMGNYDIASDGDIEDVLRAYTKPLK